jgi:hypothetical protein
MKPNKDLFKINVNSREIYRGFRSNRDRVQIFANNTYSHELAKFRLAYYFQKNRICYMTEATFTDGRGRADVVDMVNGVAYEIVETEKEISIKNKNLKYPFPVIKLRAIDVINTDLEDMGNLL